MYREENRFHVFEEKTDDDTPTRKQLYLPKRSNSDGNEDKYDESLSEAWTEMCGEWELDEDEVVLGEEFVEGAFAFGRWTSRAIPATVLLRPATRSVA